MIPKQLQQKNIKIILLEKKSKKPIEKNWSTKNNYSYNDPKLIKHLEAGGNYGVLCGNGLIVVDDDSGKLAKIMDKYSNSLIVNTSGIKKHYYLSCDGFDRKRVLTDGSEHLGEIQSTGSYVVGPNCIHPNGKKYRIVKDNDIITVSLDELNNLFNKYYASEKIDKKVILEGTKTGLRNKSLFKIACSNKARGLTPEENLAFIKTVNKNNQPRLPETELKTIIQSAHSYSDKTDTSISPEILNLLNNPNYFEILNRELDKKIVHEEDTRKTILLIALGGKLTINAEPTSKNLMVNDESGAGKDYITSQVLNLLPNVCKRQRISERALTYWHNKKYEPDWTWDGKILYLEDISNSVLNNDVFKVYSSSEGINTSTILIRQKVHDIITEGKPVMILTIATANPKNEMLRRFPSVNLNTTEDQTKLIIERKAKFHEQGIKVSYDETTKKSIEFLKRVKVKVPYASKLTPLLSSKNLIIRTHFDRFVDYIKFSAAIYQKQRTEDSEGYLLANKEDYELGRLALIKTTSNVFCIPLTKNQQKILEILSNLPKTKIEGQGIYEEEIKCFYSVSDLEPNITFISDRTLRIELDRLTNYGFLFKDKQKRENIPKPVMVYRYLDQIKIDIPKWDELQNTSNASSTSFTSNTSNTSNTTKNQRFINKKGVFEVNEVNATHSAYNITEKKVKTSDFDTDIAEEEGLGR